MSPLSLLMPFLEILNSVLKYCTNLSKTYTKRIEFHNESWEILDQEKRQRLEPKQLNYKQNKHLKKISLIETSVFF